MYRTETSTHHQPYLILTRSVCFGHSHVHDPAGILWFWWRGSEAADARLRGRAGCHTVCVVVGPGCHLLRGCVRDEALCDGELGVAQLLFHLGMLVRSGELLVRRGSTLRGHHTASSTVCMGIYKQIY